MYEVLLRRYIKETQTFLGTPFYCVMDDPAEILSWLAKTNDGDIGYYILRIRELVA